MKKHLLYLGFLRDYLEEYFPLKKKEIGMNFCQEFLFCPLWKDAPLLKGAEHLVQIHLEKHAGVKKTPQLYSLPSFLALFTNANDWFASNWQTVIFDAQKNVTWYPWAGYVYPPIHESTRIKPVMDEVVYTLTIKPKKRFKKKWKMKWNKAMVF